MFNNVKVGDDIYFNKNNRISVLEVTKVTKTYIEAKQNDLPDSIFKFTIKGNVWGDKSNYEYLLNWTKDIFEQHIENQNKAKRTNELRNNILMKIRQNSYIGNLELYEEINKLVEQLK